MFNVLLCYARKTYCYVMQDLTITILFKEMSQNEFKGCGYTELFSTNNKLLVESWKTDVGVKKMYDDQAKTFVYCIGVKSPVPQMMLPKDNKKKLGIRHPILVLQICFPVGASILIDIGITSGSSQRKRITLSSNLKLEKITLLSAAVPLPIKKIKMEYGSLDMTSYRSTCLCQEILFNHIN